MLTSQQAGVHLTASFQLHLIYMSHFRILPGFAFLLNYIWIKCIQLRKTFSISALLYYQLTMIFPKTLCGKSDSLPFNNMTLHWFLQLRYAQGAHADVTYPLIPQLWTVHTCKHIFPRGHRFCGIMSVTAIWCVLVAPFWICIRVPLVVF